MLTTIQNALKTKEIRMKLLYVLIGLVIVRIGCNIPIPGTKPDVMQNLFSKEPVPWIFGCYDRWFILKDVYFCIEHHALHHCIYYLTAFDNRNSAFGRDAERWRRWT